MSWKKSLAFGQDPKVTELINEVGDIESQFHLGLGC